jgi:hypothetical protein
MQGRCDRDVQELRRAFVLRRVSERAARMEDREVHRRLLRRKVRGGCLCRRMRARRDELQGDLPPLGHEAEDLRRCDAGNEHARPRTRLRPAPSYYQCEVRPGRQRELHRGIARDGQPIQRLSRRGNLDWQRPRRASVAPRRHAFARRRSSSPGVREDAPSRLRSDGHAGLPRALRGPCQRSHSTPRTANVRKCGLDLQLRGQRLGRWHEPRPIHRPHARLPHCIPRDGRRADAHRHPQGRSRS